MSVLLGGKDAAVEHLAALIADAEARAGQGATSTEIDVLLGHEMGSPETRVYVRSAERARLAEAVIGRVDAMVGIRK